MLGRESWVLGIKYKKRLEAAQMSFMRSTLGVTRGLKISNEGRH
jgi:hypothetical protein